MNTEGRPVGDDDIEGAIDGRLDPDRRAAVDAYLDANPSVQARVSADRAIRDELRSRLGPAAAEPVPPRLRIGSIRARRGAATRRRLGMAAALRIPARRRRGGRVGGAGPGRTTCPDGGGDASGRDR